jgi:MtN3 and saliva related transmembrane protein
MASFLGITAALWGVVMAIAPILQIRRMIVRRSSEDLSLGYFAVLLPGFALWVAYGWARADWPLVVPNALALTVGLGTVAVGLRLRRQAAGEATPR